MFAFLKLISPTYRKRRESVLRLRRMRRTKRAFVRLLNASLYPGHPSEFPDAFERWLDQWRNGRNVGNLYHEAKES
jgi:hypothetical protein